MKTRETIKYGKWVTIVKNIPTNPSPPKLSIHYSVPWINEDAVCDAYNRLSHISNTHLDLGIIEYPIRNTKYDKNKPTGEKIKTLEKCPKLFDDMWGQTANPVYDVGIKYQGEKIRIHGYEYNEITVEHFQEIFPEAYEFIALNEVRDAWADIKLSKEKRVIYEEALLDGCTEYQALQVVYGKMVQDFPAPVGWYKLKKQYSDYFGIE